MSKLSALLAFSLLFLMGASSQAAKAPPIIKDYPADKIAEGIHVIHGPLETPNPGNQGFMNNPGIVITEAGVVVVDPGGSVQSGEMVIAHIEKLTDKPVVAVFDSHVHGDHWLGNQAFVEKYPDVKVYAHPEMIKAVKHGAGDEWMVMAMRMTEGAVEGTKVVNATLPVDNGDSIEIGGLHFNIYHNGKAHTHTDIMVHIPEREVMFLGDNAAVNRLIRNEGSFKGNIAALEDAIKTQTKVFVPGHGPSSGDSAAIYANYLKTVYKLVREQYGEGLSDFEIKPVILPKMKKWGQWADFNRMVGAHINSIYHEVEADEF